MYKNSSYYLQYDYLSLLNIQIFLIRQKTIHNISSFAPQFLQKRKKKQVRRPALGYTNTKKVKFNPKQPSCKIKSAALKQAIVRKDVKSKVAAKKWL